MDLRSDLLQGGGQSLIRVTRLSDAKWVSLDSETLGKLLKRPSTGE